MIFQRVSEPVGSFFTAGRDRMELEELESLAVRSQLDPHDIHAFLTALSSGEEPLLRREFYRIQDGRPVIVTSEEVSDRTALREQDPEGWGKWAKQIFVAWRKEEP